MTEINKGVLPESSLEKGKEHSPADEVVGFREHFRQSIELSLQTQKGQDNQPLLSDLRSRSIEEVGQIVTFFNINSEEELKGLLNTDFMGIGNFFQSGSQYKFNVLEKILRSIKIKSVEDYLKFDNWPSTEASDVLDYLDSDNLFRYQVIAERLQVDTVDDFVRFWQSPGMHNFVINLSDEQLAKLSSDTAKLTIESVDDFKKKFNKIK